MSKRRWFLVFLVMVSFLLNASLASAQSLIIEYFAEINSNPDFLYTGFHTWDYVISAQTTNEGEFHISGGGNSYGVTFGDKPADYSVAFHFTGSLSMGLWFPDPGYYEETGELPPLSVTCTAKTLIDGTETTICSGTVDRAMVLSGIGLDPVDYKNEFWFWGAGDLGTIDVPVTWYDDCGGWSQYCNFEYSWPIFFDIQEVVPLPSTLLLLGSGLVGLAIVKRRKWVLRS